ncbi:phage holin family protein [uncultured Ruegeria sp.]|uniref:phage holin family protein n=1 Tax=uncultured Ruegeria sp. TaxID=259304 RepID=UPI0026127B65|nr:phage holin family protein [uncultured Ruegeria sp.]
MNRISRNISIALRAERLIAQRHMAVIRNQTGLMAAAGLVAGIGLIMINVAAFFALNASLSSQVSALIVALANFGLAVVLAVAASRMSADADVQGATEVRDMAIEDLEAELTQAATEVKEVVTDIRQMVRNPLGAVLPGVVGPLAEALLKSGKKK